METVGISPKVYVPLLVNVLGVIALYLVGEKELAVGAILAVLSQAGLGYAASPGAVSLDSEVIDDLIAEAYPVPDGVEAPESD